MYCSSLTLIVALGIFAVNGKCTSDQKLVKLADREKCMLEVVSLSKCIICSSVKFKFLKKSVDDVCNEYQLVAHHQFNENQQNSVITSDEEFQSMESSTNGLENESSTQFEMDDDVSGEDHIMESELSTSCLKTECSTQSGNHDNLLVGENQYLLAYYAFECDVKDTSGNERHGRSNGTDLTYTTGVSGLAANFTGSQRVVVDEFSNFDFGSEFTVSLWYKGLEGGDNQQFILNNGFRDDGEFEFKLGPNNLFVSLFTLIEARFEYVPVVQFGVWRHLVLTYNGSCLAFYVNAEIQSGQSDCCSGPIPINSNPVVIGTAHGSNRRYFHGLIDEVQFYNITVASQHVETYYYNVTKIIK
ncbi:uncharacterized protein [Antedon mediterranea]|uniref:uncharacterized protein n=1 Tax=Antedon mediterranea TaxID=105859 RepID=UPI003AF82E99